MHRYRRHWGAKRVAMQKKPSLAHHLGGKGIFGSSHRPEAKTTCTPLARLRSKAVATHIAGLAAAHLSDTASRAMRIKEYPCTFAAK
jgi:hypothetical protein